MPELTRLLRYVRPYWARLTSSVLLMAGVGALEGATPFLLALVIDRVLRPTAALPEAILLPGPWSSIDLRQFVPAWLHNDWTVVAFIILTVMTAKAVFEYAASYLVNYIGFAVVTDLRNQLYQHLQQQSLGFYTTTRAGEIVSRVNNDVAAVQEVATTTIVTIASNVFSLVATLIVIFGMDPWLSVLAVVSSAGLRPYLQRTQSTRAVAP